MKLESTNQHCFIYKTEELLIELLGGVRPETDPCYRFTMYLIWRIILYNGTQVEKFVRRVAEKLAISDITSHLEEYRRSPAKIHK